MIIGISGKIGSGKDLIGEIINYLLGAKGLHGSISLEEYRTCESKYIDKTKEFQIKKFADSVKDIVCLLINCTREQLEDREFKNKELGEEWWHIKQFTVEDDYEICSYSDPEYVDFEGDELIKLTPRKLMQLIGTDSGRNIIHPNIWINAVMSKYRTEENRHVSPSLSYYPSNWIITDVRFPNELKAIEDKEGINIRVNRDWQKDCNHCGRTVREQMQQGCKDITCYRQNRHSNEHPSETALDGATFNFIIDNNGTIEELVEKVKIVLTHAKVI